MHDTNVQLLKRTRPIQEVVEGYGIPLRRVGRSLVGRCPFHHDGGRPNLTVYPASESFYCFRCSLGGDVITFIRQLEGLSFPDALARLEGKPATLPRPINQVRPVRPYRTGWPGMDERACLLAAVDFYYNQLLRTDEALGYLGERGIERATIERHCLGFASGHGLIDYLRWRHLPIGAAGRVGLLSRSGAEFFAGRLVVAEVRAGQVIWLTGRTIADNAGVPRYLSLPGRRPVLGWEDVRHEPWVVLTEGVFDWLVLRQWGYPAIGIGGTAVGPRLLDALRRFEAVYLALDSDPAGQQASTVAEEHLGPAARRLDIPDVKDVAELATVPGGRELFEAALEPWHALAA